MIGVLRISYWGWIRPWTLWRERLRDGAQMLRSALRKANACLALLEDPSAKRSLVLRWQRSANELLREATRIFRDSSSPALQRSQRFMREKDLITGFADVRQPILFMEVQALVDRVLERMEDECVANGS